MHAKLPLLNASQGSRVPTQERAQERAFKGTKEDGQRHGSQPSIKSERDKEESS